MSLLTERELQLIWLLGLYRRRGLLTEDGRSVDVYFPGFPAGEGGPDFRAARIAIGGEIREGDVEVHLTPAGWRLHGHAGDSSYAAVILHVALRRDPLDRPNRGLAGPLAELILEPYLELPVAELLARLVRPAPRGGSPESIRMLGEARLESRIHTLERLGQGLSADGALYRELMVGLGYKNNKPGFAELARMVPWPRVQGAGAETSQCLYEERAREIPWRRAGRPANHPLRRIRGWSRFIGSLGGAGLLETFARGIDQAESRLDPDGTGEIGRERARDLVVNAVLPALVAFGSPQVRDEARDRLREAERGPANRRVREAAAALGVAVPRATIERMGLLEWRARQ
ncbi:MAG: DUF2851 family protein [Planctomycetes bacterium]|nr:DUF2851 family protein [Planctomycetota bacterium]